MLREWWNAYCRLYADNLDALQGMATLKAFNTKIADGLRSGAQHAATDAITAFRVLIVLGTAALLATTGQLELELELLPVAVVVAATTFQPLIAVSAAGRDLNLILASVTRIEKILDEPAPVSDLVSTSPAGPVEARVRFIGVTFRYGPQLPDAVTNVSFEIAPGETVALVGHSGAGKSTCVQLLLRMWDVRAGAITIGGHDLREFRQEGLRRLLTLVPQDAYLFNISLRDNIRLGRPDATDEQVEEAAGAGRVDEFIGGLPDGYDTVVGESGSRLSGGQRQRIVIARALLKDAPRSSAKPAPYAPPHEARPPVLPDGALGDKQERPVRERGRWCCCGLAGQCPGSRGEGAKEGAPGGGGDRQGAVDARPDRVARVIYSTAARSARVA